MLNRAVARERIFRKAIALEAFEEVVEKAGRAGRVERWRGGVGFGILLFRGFPFLCLNSRVPCSASTSRSSNRTADLRHPALGQGSWFRPRVTSWKLGQVQAQQSVCLFPPGSPTPAPAGSQRRRLRANESKPPPGDGGAGQRGSGGVGWGQPGLLFNGFSWTEKKSGDPYCSGGANLLHWVKSRVTTGTTF